MAGFWIIILAGFSLAKNKAMKTETAYDWKVLEAVREGTVSEEQVNILLEEYLQRFTQIIRVC
jgi:hypothetical protein